MSMWEPFTAPARDSMVRAQEIAQQHGDSFISQHHIFVAVSEAPDVAGILEALGIGRDRIEKAAEKLLGEEAPERSQELAFTGEAKRLIELAFENARKLDNNFIAPEHMVLGYIALGPRHSQMLAEVEVDVETLREKLVASLASKPKRVESPRRKQRAAGFEDIYAQAGGLAERHKPAELWNGLQSAAERGDLAGVFVYALSVAFQERATANELLGRINVRFGEISES